MEWGGTSRSSEAASKRGRTSLVLTPRDHGVGGASTCPTLLLVDIGHPPTTYGNRVINKKLLHIPGFWIICPLWHILRAYHLTFACSVALARSFSATLVFLNSLLEISLRTESHSSLRKQTCANRNQVMTSHSSWSVNPSFSFSIASPSSSEKTGSRSCCFFKRRRYERKDNKAEGTF